MRLLMQAIADPQAPAQTELITPSLVIRSSTARALPPLIDGPLKTAPDDGR